MFKDLIPRRHKEKKPAVRGEIGTTNQLARFRDEFDALLGRFYGGQTSIWDDLDQWNIGWGCDVEDAEKELIVRAEAPGFDPDEIEVQMSGNRLVLQARHKEEKEDKNGRSRQYGKFYRTMTVPQGIEADKIKADYKNGVLEVHLPKGSEAQSKRIPVNGN